MCRFVDGQPLGGWIYQNDLWRAGILEGLENPGWVVVALRRHALEITAMDHTEAATFGPLLVELSGTIKEVTNAERVYVLGYGENEQHFHILLAPRGSDVPPEHRHALLWLHREDYRDPAHAAEIAKAIRDALSERALPDSRRVE